MSGRHRFAAVFRPRSRSAGKDPPRPRGKIRGSSAAVPSVLAASIVAVAAAPAPVEEPGNGISPSHPISSRPAILVRFADAPDAGEASARLAAAGAERDARLRAPHVGGLHRAFVTEGLAAGAVLRLLRSRHDVLYAELDPVAFLAETRPNGPRFGEQYNLENTGQNGSLPGADVDAPAAWDVAAALPPS